MADIEIHVPTEVREGDKYELTGSDFTPHGPHIRVNIGYPNRSETLQVRVADQEDITRDDRLHLGDIALLLDADQPGVVDIVIYTWNHRDELARAQMVVTPRG